MLEKYDFLDVEAAMPYVGDDEEIYEVVVASYLEEEKTADLQKFFDAQDWQNYRIVVHGVKSTSYTIGATAMGDKAKESEFCVKDGDYQGAIDRHESLMADYNALLDKIRSVVE